MSSAAVSIEDLPFHTLPIHEVDHFIGTDIAVVAGFIPKAPEHGLVLFSGDEAKAVYASNISCGFAIACERLRHSPGFHASDSDYAQEDVLKANNPEAHNFLQYAALWATHHRISERILCECADAENGVIYFNNSQLLNALVEPVQLLRLAYEHQGLANIETFIPSVPVTNLPSATHVGVGDTTPDHILEVLKNSFVRKEQK